MIELFLEACFIQSQFQISIYYKYAIDGTKIVVLSYVDYCVYWYTYESLGNFLRKIYEIYSILTSWDMHIGSCQLVFTIWMTIPFQCIRLDMLLLLCLSTWILPQSIQVHNSIRPLSHMILYSPRLIRLPVMIKFRSWLGNSICIT